MINLYNSLSGKKEALVPLQNGKVSMYCCGVTPYSNTHVGHSRTFFSYDLLHRTLSDAKLEVKWARNITDVDDKIIKKAAEENCSCADIVNRYVQEQNEQLSVFELGKPQFEPKVTENIEEIVQQVQVLISKNFAYETSTGVYFRVRNFSEYGKLSKNKIDDLRSGARIEIDDEKEDPLDFVLWKKAKSGEVSWASPFGEGRPGWHIECSAMIQSIFGDSIDIHMGGRDLIFPHHEAEIAQSECATGKHLASIWMHCGMVTLYGEKMSKSTNHYVSIKDFLTKYPPEVLRLTFLGVNYSQPLDFTNELAEQNLKTLGRLYRAVQLFDELSESQGQNSIATTVFAGIEHLVEKMRVHLADDLNSPAALATLFEFVRKTNRALGDLQKKSVGLSAQDLQMLKDNWQQVKSWLSSCLGIVGMNPKDFFQMVARFKGTGEFSESIVLEKITLRNEARNSKDWKKSDDLRNELLAMGIQLQDTNQGTKWTVEL